MHKRPEPAGGRPLAAGLGLSLCLLAVGCGASTGSLSGKVSYKGTLLKGGTIAFVSSDQSRPPAFTNIGQDGRYSLTGVPSGEVVVTVETVSAKKFQPPKVVKGVMPKVPEGKESPYMSATYGGGGDRYVQIPDTYSDPKKSKLKLTVSGGTQEHDFNLD
jgi:hypothetical protein